MSWRNGLVCGTLVLSGIFSCVVMAEDGREPADSWQFTVGPEFSAPGFKGNGAVGPLAGKMKMPFHKVASDTRFAFAGGIAATKGPLGIWIDGQYLDLSQNFSFDDGRVDGKAKGHATQLTAGMWYQVWEKATGGQTVHGTQQKVSVSPLAGVRWTRLKATLEADDHTVSQRETWAIPFAGARVSTDLSDRWLVTTEADIGAWGRDFTTQVQASLGYRLSLFGNPAMALLGYQVLHQDHKESDFHWDITQFGPTAGLSVTF